VIDVPAVSPARHQPDKRSTSKQSTGKHGTSKHSTSKRGARNLRRRSVRGGRRLLYGLLLVPVMVAGGLYLSRSASPAASPPAAGHDTALQTAAACGSAAAGPCAASPIQISTAQVPRAPVSARSRHPARQHTPSASALPSQARTSPAASATPAGAASVPPSTPAALPGSSAKQVLALINQARSTAGLPALTITAGLDASASAHNSTMAGGCGLSHQCPGEPPLGARETAAAVHWTAAGENIGEGGPVADSTAAIARMAVTLTQDMLNEKPPDDGHRRNILSSSFIHIGIAIYRDSSGTVWLTQDFSN